MTGTTDAPTHARTQQQKHEQMASRAIYSSVGHSLDGPPVAPIESEKCAGHETVSKSDKEEVKREPFRQRFPLALKDVSHDFPSRHFFFFLSYTSWTLERQRFFPGPLKLGCAWRGCRCPNEKSVKKRPTSEAPRLSNPGGPRSRAVQHLVVAMEERVHQLGVYYRSFLSGLHCWCGG